jgi:DHA1 family bicyclomycin/chloramphenicol resistance-like MFS transporter
MKTIKEHHYGISTVLAFALIPLSGFATDIYIPSLPSIAMDLHVSTAAVQLSLVLFFVSSGISQLFVGAVLDSFGRYRASLFALAVFAISSFVIAVYPDIYVLYAMRIVQGITISLIVVGKRAFFVDMYSGEQLKHYTSLFVIIWSTAPILAPFIGGYLQSIFGWHSSFYFLGGLAVVFLILEMLFSGESLAQFHPFKAKTIFGVYTQMLRTGDFAVGLVIIGCCYGLVVMYGMASPFIIERVFNFSPIITGYSSLLSGVAIMIGGTIAKAIIKIPVQKKIPVAIILMAVFSLLIMFSGLIDTNIYIMIGLTICLHITGGFVFNVIYGYCLGRFSKNAGTAAGLTGGGMYIASSFISYGLVSVYGIKTQTMLGVSNITGVVILVILFAAFSRFRKIRIKDELHAVNQTWAG